MGRVPQLGNKCDRKCLDRESGCKTDWYTWVPVSCTGHGRHSSHNRWWRDWLLLWTSLSPEQRERERERERERKQRELQSCFLRGSCRHQNYININSICNSIFHRLALGAACVTDILYNTLYSCRQAQNRSPTKVIQRTRETIFEIASVVAIAWFHHPLSHALAV